MSLRLSFLFCGTLAFALAAACGDDDDPSGSGGTGATGNGGSAGASVGGTGGASVGGTGGTGAGGTGGTSGDASEDGNTGGVSGSVGDSGECSTFANTSGVVELIEIAATPPAQTGGSITPGKYILTGYSRYTDPGGNSGPTGQTLKETLTFTATTLESVEAVGTVEAGIGGDERNTYAYTTAGSNLALAPACGPAPGQAVQYTAATSDAGVTSISFAIGKLLVVFTQQ